MSGMMKNESITIDKRTLEFLLFSYFGKAKSAVEAAINVAYRDMAAHTLRYDKDKFNITDVEWKEEKNSYKDNGIEKIKEALGKLVNIAEKDESDKYKEYCNWHKELCTALNEAYGYKENKAQLTFGQAQKWVNMTMKYLYIFYLLNENGAMNCTFLGEKNRYELDKDLKKNIGKTWTCYHIPLDNYILESFSEKKEELKLKDIDLKVSGSTYKIRLNGRYYSWSQIPFDIDEHGNVKKSTCEDYYNLQDKVRQNLKEECSGMLLWEFENWLKTAMK